MPISHLHKTIFVHIPKTAGTSVEAALGMHGDKRDIGVVPHVNRTADRERLYGHDLEFMTAARLKAVLNNDDVFDSYFKFTIVRNPWERLVSTCAWSDLKWANGQELTPAAFDQVVRGMYAAFVEARAASKLFVLSTHLNPQFTYILDDGLRPMVNFIARYENLAEDWRLICKHLALDIALPSRMKSHHRPYREYYNEETQAMVEQMYPADVKLLGYAF